MLLAGEWNANCSSDCRWKITQILVVLILSETYNGTSWTTQTATCNTGKDYTKFACGIGLQTAALACCDGQR